MQNNTHTAKAVFGQDETKNTNLNQNEKRMKKENTKSAGVSHPAANTDNLGNNIDENDLINRMNYLNEKVTYEIEGFSGKFETCRWMHDIVSKAATKAQFKSFSYLTRIA